MNLQTVVNAKVMRNIMMRMGVKMIIHPDGT
jgi:hypothetical protein